ncbi:MAG TPA: hypothetical protein VGV40_12810 [Solirubrobacteraceae bacterium]|nr:hypothetical protein [Solirubrobacteraceae bacterium]
MHIWIRRGLWALPVWGLLTLLATLTHQPDPTTEFGAFARYVSTDRFLVSHLIGSIFGTAVGILGLAALAAYLADTPVRGRALLALVLSVIGVTLTASVFGAAAFAQPAVGEAQLAGQANAKQIYEAIYDTPLFVTAGLGVLLYSAGSIVFGLALWRVRTLPRWTGVFIGLSGPLIGIVGLSLGAAQTVGSTLLTVAGVAIAWTALRRLSLRTAPVPAL